MKDSVNQDNRRAFPKFLAVVAGAAALGGVGGFLMAMAAEPETLEAIRAGLDRVMEAVCPWGIPVSGVALLRRRGCTTARPAGCTPAGTPTQKKGPRRLSGG